jgi:hypothetical protein
MILNAGTHTMNLATTLRAKGDHRNIKQWNVFSTNGFKTAQKIHSLL